MMIFVGLKFKKKIRREINKRKKSISYGCSSTKDMEMKKLDNQRFNQFKILGQLIFFFH